MKTESQILKNYFGLVRSLSPGIKLKLIEKLSQSIGKDIRFEKDSMGKAFGAWNDSRDSEQIIQELRESRAFYRKTDSL